MTGTGVASLARADVLDAVTQAVQGVALAASTVDVPVHHVMPPTLYPPCVLITEGDPFIEPSDTLGTYQVHFELIALVAPSSDESVMLADLDTLIDHLAAGLDQPQVAAYQTFTFANQQPLFGARLTLASAGWTIGKD
jgi:hypothetical protein